MEMTSVDEQVKEIQKVGMDPAQPELKLLKLNPR